MHAVSVVVVATGKALCDWFEVFVKPAAVGVATGWNDVGATLAAVAAAANAADGDEDAADAAAELLPENDAATEAAFGDIGC